MSPVISVLVLLLSLKVNGIPIFRPDFGLVTEDGTETELKERPTRSLREIASEEDEYGWPSSEENQQSESNNRSIVAPTNSNDHSLEKALEKEVNKQSTSEDLTSKEKRQICSRIMEQLKSLPCDHPMVITCGGDDGQTFYPCNNPSTPESSLRAALSDVDNILNPDNSIETAYSEPRPQALPQISPIQTLPVISSIGGNPLASLQTNTLLQRLQGRPILPGNSLLPVNSLLPGRPALLQPSRILTEAERRERQKGIFEGLLRVLAEFRLVLSSASEFVHLENETGDEQTPTLTIEPTETQPGPSKRQRFGTVVNHVDSFLTDKGKMIVKGLYRMVESEEDSRFD